MAQTFHCAACDTNWAAYMAIDSACCECGTGLVRSHEAMSDDAPDRHRAAMISLVERDRVEEGRAQNRRDFDLFVARRDAEHPDEGAAA